MIRIKYKSYHLLPVYVLLLCSFLFGAESDGDKIKGKIEGTLYTNWHYDMEENASPASSFEIDRAYFGYKFSQKNKFTARIMLDAGREDVVTGIDSSGSEIEKEKKSSRLRMYLKYGYLEFKKPVPKTSLVFGLHGQSQFKYQEKFWGYRYIYKSFMDEHKYGSSADLGAAAKVKFTEKFKLKLHVVNGEGYKNVQSADGKYKTTLSSELRLFKGLSMYVYGDVMPYEGTDPQYTAAGFIGYEHGDLFRLGAEYDYQGNHGGVKNENLNGISVYSSLIVRKIDIFARYDMLTHDDFSTSSQLLIAGLQYAPFANIKISPNLQMNIEKSDVFSFKPEIYINAEAKF